MYTLFHRIFILIFLSSSGIYAQRGIDIQFSAKKIEVGEPLTIIYTANNLDEKQLLPPKFDPFVVVAGPNVSRSLNTSVVNGQWSQTRSNSYTYQLVCKKIGKYTIPKFGFLLPNGQKVESSPLEVEVVKEGTIPRQATHANSPYDPFDPFSQFFDPFDPFQQGGRGMPQQRAPMPTSPAPQQNSGVYSDPSKIDLKRDIFAKIIVNKNKCYVGEQINASIKIYTALNSKGFEAEKLPNFNGFWTQDIKLPEKLEMKRETIGGREFVSVEIKKIVLFPTKAGTLEISPLKMKTIAMVPVRTTPQAPNRQPQDLFEAIQMMMNDQYGSMGGVEYKEVPYNFSSGSEHIEVMPLPENAPQSFTGAVGSYQFSTFCNKKNLKTDEALSFIAELKGNGNLPMIGAPKTEWNPEFEGFDPQISENYSTEPNFSGTKTWNYTLIPHQPGSFETPKVAFTYFDLSQRKYITIETPSTPLTITGSPTKSKSKGKQFNEFDYAKQSIKHTPYLTQSAPMTSTTFWLWSILPLLAAAALYWAPAPKESKDRFISSKKVSELIRKQMKQAQVYLQENKKQEFYNEVTRAYWSYVGNKLHIEPSLLSRDNIADRLREKNVTQDTIDQFIQLIDSSEMGLYTSFGTQAMQQQYDHSLEILTELEKQLA